MVLRRQVRPLRRPDERCIAHCRDGQRCQLEPDHFDGGTGATGAALQAFLRGGKDGRVAQRVGVLRAPLDGKRPKVTARLPLCAKHRRFGDGSVFVASHARCGKILVARVDLPAGYRLLYHGPRQTNRSKEDDKVDYDEDRTVWFYPGVNSPKVNGYLDPTGLGGCQMQFAACPGPGEVPNLRKTGLAYGRRNCGYGGIEYKTSRPVPAGTQLLHWYGPGWWNDREDVVRADVGTARYPAPKRKVAEKT